MTGKFSKYLKNKKPILKQLIAQLAEKYAYVSVLATDVTGVNIQVDRSTTVVQPTSITESGFVIKVFNGVIYSEYSVNEIEEKSLPTIIKTIDSLVSQKSTVPHVKVQKLQEEPLTQSFIRKNKGKVPSTQQIITTLKTYVNEAIAYSPLIINAHAGIETTEISKMFLSNVKDLEQYYTWSNPRSYVFARRDSNTKYAYDGFGINSVEKGLASLQASMMKSAKLAIELLDSTTPKPGIYDIITDPSITGLIAHEAFGHGVEMDMFVRNRSQAQSYMNQRVASPLVTMHDGADATFSVASYFFDDDGVLARDTKIIDKGILISGISDALSALQLGTVPTGNGRRESYKRKAYSRMTNTFFESGSSKLENMIKSIEYGYLISTTNNGMEDPKNWGIQCTAQFGREIINGEFTGKIISPVVMSGYVIDLLNSISAVSKDFKVIGSGSCGKGYKEWVRVSDGGPCLKAKVKIG
ncbi:MAG: TldD/PmbA family protein [Candidatus Izemoplasmatales bacterium]|jgi:TldD protein|nr:TldD/PmbA family protein [Candidatus Izemoplasmatales bacterium]